MAHDESESTASDPSSALADRLALLPRPATCVGGDGDVSWSGRVGVAASEDTVDAIGRLAGEGPGLRFEPAGDGADLTVVSDATLADGAYALEVANGVRIAHRDHAGLVHAVQTLRQLMPADALGRGPAAINEITLPAIRIDDAPALRWRGAHLDVARHFVPLSFLYDVVDLLSLHKINVLHLHLTDDQGWRFEVRGYPKLTAVGATRAGTRFPDWDESDGVPHGGFYTQDQLRALVAYAGARAIHVVPEIDLPGHVRALLTAYPEFGEPGSPPPGVAEEFGIHEQVLHLSDATVAMVEDVLAELLDVFDSPWIHVGGDECPRTQWRASSAAQELAASRGLPSVDHLQRWFTEHLREWLSARGRILVGWDEVIDEAEVPGALVMSWRGIEPGLRALASGHEVVMTPAAPYYLDHYQDAGPDEPRSIHGLNTWHDVARHDPFASVPAEHRDRMIGTQVALWSEYLIDPRQVEYAAFPRLCVFAETAWTGRPADPDELAPRLEAHLRRLDARGVNYRPLAGPQPWQHGGGRYRRLAH